MSGTSYSAAEVSGIVALMLQRKPNLTPDQVRTILRATAKDLGPIGPDVMFGAGLVDAYRALSVEAAPTSPRPGRVPSAGRGDAPPNRTCQCGRAVRSIVSCQISSSWPALPGVHALFFDHEAWMAGTGPVMT